MRRRAFALFLLLLTLFACFSPQALAVSPEDWDAENPGALLPEHLYAQTAVLIDGETGDVLFDKGSLVRMYPASTTKIMDAFAGRGERHPPGTGSHHPRCGGKCALGQLCGARPCRRAHGV